MNLLPGWFPAGVIREREVLAFWTATRFDEATGNTHVFADVPIGPAHPSRRIFAHMFTVNANLNGNGSITSMSIGGVAVDEVYSTPGVVTGKRNIRAANVPTGDTATIVANRNIQSGFALFYMAVFAVYHLKDIVPLEVAESNTGGDGVATLDVLEGGAILAFANSGAGAPTIAWSGATVADNTNTGSLQLSSAVNNPTFGGTQNLLADSTGNVQMITCSLR